jgi:hypothetical protein
MRPRAGSTPISAFSVVDLPAPLGPITVTTLPGAAEVQAVQHLGAAVAGVQAGDFSKEWSCSCGQCSVPR